MKTTKKSRKIRCRAGTISLVWYFPLNLKISSGIIWISNVKILKNISGWFIAYKSFKNDKMQKKTSRQDKIHFFACSGIYPVVFKEIWYIPNFCFGWTNF